MFLGWYKYSLKFYTHQKLYHEKFMTWNEAKFLSQCYDEKFSIMKSDKILKLRKKREEIYKDSFFIINMKYKYSEQYLQNVLPN